MYKSKEKGFVQVLLILFLLVGLGVGLYLVQTKTNLFSKAAPVTPDKPETSFELEAQADTSPVFADVTALKSVGVGQRFRVDVWVRSDIDPANLFVANLKFPADLLQVVKIDTRANNSFVKSWLDLGTFENKTGKISLIGGVPAPGLLTSSQSPVDVKEVRGVVSAPTAGVGTVSGTRAIKAGESVDLQAYLNNSAQSSQIWVTKSPDGKSDFACPGGMVTNTKQEKWCKVAEGKGPTLTGSFTFKDWGRYIITVNAFTNETATNTEDAVTQCSGNPLPSGPSGSATWSSCGPGSSFNLDVAPVPSSPISTPTTSISHPTASLRITKGSKDTGVGSAVEFNAGMINAQNGQIWVTKEDGRSQFTCPNGIYKSAANFYWCLIVKGEGSLISGSYTFAEPGSYTAVVNAFVKPDQDNVGPFEQCSGTQTSLGFDATKWSDCGPNSRLSIQVSGTSTTTPSVTKLSAARLMASIILEAKKEGAASIEFTDVSRIYRNFDSANIISAKKGLKISIIGVPTEELKPASPKPSQSSRPTVSPLPTSSHTTDSCSLGMFIKFQDVVSNGPAQKYVDLSLRQPGTNNEVFNFEGVPVKNDVSAFFSTYKTGDLYRVGLGNVECGTYDIYVNSKGYNEKKFPGIVVDTDPWNDPEAYIFNGPLQVASGSTSGPTPEPTSGQDPVCTAITADAPIGKTSKEDIIYFVESGGSTKLTAQFQPSDVRLEWVVVSKSNNLPTDGGFSNPMSNTTNYRVPENPGQSIEMITLTASVHSGGKSTNCPNINLGVKPVEKQSSTQSAKTSGVSVANLRHDGDVNSDSKIDFADMSRLLAQFNQNGQSEADLNGDGIVNSLDVLKMRAVLIKSGILSGGQ